MKLWSAKAKGHNHAFTLMDALFAMVMAGIMFLALYSGLGFGFKLIKLARENSRATQIMVQQMETIRLYTWAQVTNAGFIPTNKIVIPYYSINGTNSSLVYTSQIRIADCPVGATNVGSSYAGTMKKVTIRLDWGTLGNSNHTRFMSTYVTRNGLQNYVY